MEIYNWKVTLERERKGKDEFFASHWQSPVTLEDKSRFGGLVYYPPNPDYRFDLEFHEHKEREVLQIQDTTGNIRYFMRWGEFQFRIGDEKCTLQAYKSEPNENRLFLPFFARVS